MATVNEIHVRGRVVSFQASGLDVGSDLFFFGVVDNGKQVNFALNPKIAASTFTAMAGAIVAAYFAATDVHCYSPLQLSDGTWQLSFVEAPAGTQPPFT